VHAVNVSNPRASMFVMVELVPMIWVSIVVHRWPGNTGGDGYRLYPLLLDAKSDLM
jgi:hypothetical protein